MPFTFSHPAIVLPFLRIRRAWVSMSGLVIGSITPDFEYFIRTRLAGRYGHSIEGLFVFDLPVACAIALVFHLVVKKPLINNSPTYFYTRLIPLRDFDFLHHLRSHVLSFLCCVLIGAGSHLVWDSLTHANGLARSFPWLATPLSVGGFDIALYRVLQHASTVIGAAFIIVAFHRQPVQKHENVPALRFWITTLIIACALFAWRASFSFRYLGDIVVSIISVGIIALIIASMLSYRTVRGDNRG